MATLLNKDSVYIRRDYNEKTTVIPKLNFKKDIQITKEKKGANPIQKKSLDNLDVSPSLKDKGFTEKLTSVTFRYMQASGATPSYIGSAAYSGLCSLTFILSNGKILYPIAFTMGNSKYGYSTKLTNAQWADSDYSDFFIWFSDTKPANELIPNLWLIDDPNNLSDRDLEYFEDFPNRLKCRANIIGSKINTSNNCDWQHPVMNFGLSLYSGAIFNGNTSLRMGTIRIGPYPLLTDFHFEEITPLFYDIVGLQFIPFGQGATLMAAASMYGMAGIPNSSITRFEVIKNGYLKESYNFTNFSKTRVLNKYIWIGINLTEEEQFNYFKADYSDVSASYGSYGTYDFASLAVYNPNTGKKEILETPDATMNSNTLYQNWKDSL